MISEDEFKNILSSHESAVLDFKTKFYDFNDDSKLKETAKFVKDVLSFTNTIRSKTSYIIIGVQENEDGSKVLHGVNKHIDDAMLHDKVKDKVYPRPNFKYYTINYDNKSFGILEFPITKYDIPVIATTRNLYGIQEGIIYYRNGSSNTDAKSLETIKIVDWLRSLPDLGHPSSVSSKIADCIKRLSVGEEKLSSIFSDMYKLSGDENISELKSFCVMQLKGLTNKMKDGQEVELKYRIHDVIISPHKISIKNCYPGKVTSEMIKKEMESDKDGFRYQKFLFNQSLSQIEDFLARQEGVTFYEESASLIFEDSNPGEIIYAYIFKDMWSYVYGNIRQKAIDELIQL